jgi:5S rRNA maturation endonuclease (ribonuclease M5)
VGRSGTGETATGKANKSSEKTSKPFIHPELGKPDRIYNYTDQDGKKLFHVCRFDPKSQGEEKTFRQCKPDGITWNTNRVPLVLYNLPEIKNVTDLCFVEGEKDVHALKELGLPATTNPMGAGKLTGQQTKHEILTPLKDKTVYIFPDNDKAGHNHADELASLLLGTAKTIKIVRLPEVPEHGDVSEFIERQGKEAKAGLIELIASAPVWVPPKSFYTLQDLYELPTDDHISIIDGGIMPYNSHILIAGESGVGKSLLRLELAIHLAMGWDWMGFQIPRARTVAIFQYENSEHTERFRVLKMVKGLGTTIDAIGDRIRYAKRDERYNLTLKGDREKRLKRVKELGCEVIIYDCLSNLHNANENDNIKMREVLDILTDINAELKTSCIVIHHFGKPGENPTHDSYRIRGASAIFDWAYTVITFTRKPHEEKTLRKIQFGKVRDGKEPRPFYIERDDESFLCQFYDEESLVSPGLVRKILDEQFNGSVEQQKPLVSAIISKTGCGEKTAKQGIRHAVEMKVIYEFKGEDNRSKAYRIPMSG